MRKAVTIVFSFYFFAKPFTLNYIWAGLVVVLAIYLNIYSKNHQTINNSLATWWSKNVHKTKFEKKLVLGV